MGRKPKLENSDPSINFRLPEELKRKVEKEAQGSTMTVSKYLRKLVGEVMDGTICEEVEKNNDRDNFLRSLEFLKLVVWIYSKKGINYECKESLEELGGYLKTLKSVDEYLPKEISAEFEKVLFDVLRVKSEKQEKSYRPDFKFSKGYPLQQSFDYTKWEEYMLKTEGEYDEYTVVLD